MTSRLRRYRSASLMRGFGFGGSSSILGILVIAGLLGSVLSGCASQGREPVPGATEPTPCAPCRCECPSAPGAGALSSALLSRLATARALHHQADLLLSRGEVDAAIGKVRAIMSLDLAARWPEAEEARLDAAARLATLLFSKKKDIASGLAIVDAALAQNPRASFYAANVHSVRGDLLEARVKVLDGQGKKVQAKRAAREAMAAFEVSIRINKALQARLRRGTVNESGASKVPSSKVPPKSKARRQGAKRGGER
ncbi:MAG: hypothetical protein KAI47_18355 [Deltaproteobacteria bacterium]|nr:hypothetical protein [Deltaproteobacteria bacterium]